MTKFNKYLNNPYGANLQQPTQSQPQAQQSAVDVNDMLNIAMETEAGKKAYNEWLQQRDIVLSLIAKEVPQGMQAYTNFENKIKEIYNNVLLQTVKQKSSKDETDSLKETIRKMQEQIDKLSEGKNDKSTSK